MTTTARQPAVGSTELARIESLLSSDPAQAEVEAGRLLAKAPGHAMAMLFQGIARRLTGAPQAAIEVLTPLCRSAPDAPMAHLQLGLAWRESGDTEAAVQSMRRAVAVKPDFGDAWLALADLLHAAGDSEGADQAFIQYIEHSARDFAEPTAALSENRTADAEAFLRKHLEQSPKDIRAMCLLAEVASRHARYDAAEALLKNCLELTPSYRAARHNYSVVLLRGEKPAEALRQVERLMSDGSADVGLLNLKAAIFQRLGDYESAIAVYEQILARQEDQPEAWASLGHMLRTVGRLDACLEAYRKATALAPGFGEAYWNLANLKTFRLPDSELEAMRKELEQPALESEDRINFCFAIGKALEDKGAFDESFRYYAEGNRLRRASLSYDADAMTQHVRRSRAFFTSAFFIERQGFGELAPDPIFIVGLPRSGSTLVEQILASHSEVEGTSELPHMIDIAKALAHRTAAEGRMQYPEVLENAGEQEVRELGQLYLERARDQRRQGTPFFVDKMPNNFAHLGLIHLILPKARIIDVRRHPMACGLSIYKHLFARGQHFSYSLEDIGRYYSDYIALMTHFDVAMPQAVHRVAYESLVTDTEREVRRLLEYCRLPFEESCLEFFHNPRPVSTPSSEQVRLPIFREGLAHWRNFEPWLKPLKAELERGGLHGACSGQD